MQVWKLRFGHKIKFLSRIPDFEHTVWSRFWSWSSGQILKLKFSQYFAADLWLGLWRLFLVEILELRLVKILKFKFSQNADIWLKLLLGWDYEDELCSRFFWELVKWPKEVTSVSRTQTSGPLCLWHLAMIIIYDNIPPMYILHCSLNPHNLSDTVHNRLRPIETGRFHINFVSHFICTKIFRMEITASHLICLRQNLPC